MLNQKIFFIFLCFFTHPLVAASHDLPGSLQIKLPSFRFYDGSKIKFVSNHAYQTAVQKWQTILQRSFKNLFVQIEAETNTSFEQLFSQLSNPKLLSRYHILRETDFSCNQDSQDNDTLLYQEQDNIDPEILNFIKNVVYRHTTKRNITFVLTSHISTLTTTYGSDLHQHYVFCNACIYTKEAIRNYYDSLQKEHGVFVVERLKSNSIRAIEISNLLIFGLIEAAGKIESQSDLMSFLIFHCRLDGKKVSKSTAALCFKLYEIQNRIQAILQTNNPLEVAIFIYKSPSVKGKEKKIWKNFMQSIAQSYHQNSIKKLKDFLAQMKQQSTNH